MDNIYLSEAAFNVLLQFATPPILDISKFPESTVSYLEDLGFIERYISDYDTSGAWITSKFSEYVITEKWLGYICNRQASEENCRLFKSIADSAKKEADAAKVQADLAQVAADHAEAEAKIARRDALFSKILAILAIVATLAAPFLSAYATSIGNKLLQMPK